MRAHAPWRATRDTTQSRQRNATNEASRRAKPAERPLRTRYTCQLNRLHEQKCRSHLFVCVLVFASCASHSKQAEQKFWSANSTQRARCMSARASRQQLCFLAGDAARVWAQCEHVDALAGCKCVRCAAMRGR